VEISFYLESLLSSVISTKKSSGQQMPEEVETSETRWFKIVVFVVSGFFVGFSLANIIYFNRIRLNNGAPGITRGEATSMLWINALLFAISMIIFIWSIYHLITTRQYRQRVTEYLQEQHEGFIGVQERGSTTRGTNVNVKNRSQKLSRVNPQSSKEVIASVKTSEQTE